VPKFVLGGLLLYLGGALIYEWLIQSARRLSPIEYISLLAIALLILQIGFIAGVFIGVIIGCATFAVSASRVNAIKFSFDGSEYRSTLDREPSELAIPCGAWPRDPRHEPAKLFVLRVGQPALSAGEIAVCRPPGHPVSAVRFSPRHRPDSSAIHSFTQIKRAADELGARLVLVNLSPELRTRFSSLISKDVSVAEDLDRALEACEKDVILAHSREGSDGRGLREWFTEALGSGDYAEQLIAYCQRLDVLQDEIIASQGEPADCMHFILEGRVGIIVASTDARSAYAASVRTPPSVRWG
jgi:SulP family sulfate permease